MRSFESFWQESCSFYANMAVLMFYAGSGSLVVANGTFVSSTFLFRYRSFRGGAITFIVIFFTIPLAICLLIYMRYIEGIPMESPANDVKNTVSAKVQQLYQHLDVIRCIQAPWERIRSIWRRYFYNYDEIPHSDDGDSSSDRDSPLERLSHTDVSSLRSLSSHSVEVEIELQ